MAGTAHQGMVRALQEARASATASPRWAGIAHSAPKGALTAPARAKAVVATVAVCLITGHHRRAAATAAPALHMEPAPAEGSTALQSTQVMAAHSVTTAAHPVTANLQEATGVALWASRAAQTTAVAAPSLWAAATLAVGQGRGVVVRTVTPAMRATDRAADRSATPARTSRAEAAQWVAQVDTAAQRATAVLTTTTPAASSAVGASLTKTSAVIGTDNQEMFKRKRDRAKRSLFYLLGNHLSCFFHSFG